MHKNQSGNSILFVILGVVILAVIGFAGYKVLKHHNYKANIQTTSASTTSPSSNSSQATALPAGTSNTNLQNDLDSINGSMNQESSDQTSANAAVNDQQN